MTATIYGVGVGPGDPGLLTVRAVEVLKSVAVVATPAARSGGESLALEIARPHLPGSCTVESLELPMTEDREALAAAWERAALRLAGHARAGRSAAFITLGDPTLYSTWSYVAVALARLAPDVAVETVPGVTAMAACAVAAGEPLAAAREPLLVWPGPPPDDIRRLIERAPNVVFMKAGRHLTRLAELVESGATTATAVRRAGQADAAVTRQLRDWADDRDYFTTVLVRRCAPVLPTGCAEKGSTGHAGHEETGAEVAARGAEEDPSRSDGEAAGTAADGIEPVEKERR